MMKKFPILVVLFAFSAFSAAAQQAADQSKPKQQQASSANCPMHDAHSQMNGAQMNQRGEHAMGFSQTATTHHFLLRPDGGAIQVEANSPDDAANRDNVRMHLRHIAQAFAEGDFDIPMFVHDTVPPGVPDMKRLQEKIRYSFEETPNGGRVVLSGADKDALAAIHSFLRFQIEEHHTGDPTTLP